MKTDIDHNRVLEVEKDRTREAVDNLWETLDKTQREQVEAVAMDMWGPFMESTRVACPDAEIVHDKFHVSKYLGEAVDKVRRQDLRTGRAWSMKENFCHFWECQTVEDAKVYFNAWYTWATRSQLTPMVKVAGMLKRHLAGLVACMNHPITNATSEGFNSRIQSILIRQISNREGRIHVISRPEIHCQARFTPSVTFSETGFPDRPRDH